MKTIKYLKSWAIVLFAAFIMAANYELFIFENAFAPAGLNGIATMIQYKLGFSVGYMNLLINIPLCIMAFFVLDRDYSLKTFGFTLFFSLFLLLYRYSVIDLSAFIYHTDSGTSTILAPIAAGVINGWIYGMVIRQNACTGGTDVVAALLRKRRPHLTLVWIIFVINCGVAAASFFVYDYKFEPVILCIIYSFLTSRISDKILRGGKEAIKFEIVTEEHEEISRDIIETLHHSATVVRAKGMYSGKEKELLICVISKHQVVELQRILARHPKSFAYISAVNETVGNFKQNKNTLTHKHEA